MHVSGGSAATHCHCRFGVDYSSSCSIDLASLLSQLDYSSNGPKFYDPYIMQVRGLRVVGSLRHVAHSAPLSCTWTPVASLGATSVSSLSSQPLAAAVLGATANAASSTGCCGPDFAASGRCLRNW